MKSSLYLQRKHKVGSHRETEQYFRCKLLAFTNVKIRQLHNKMDELQANVNHMHEYRSAFILAFTETWLNKNDEESTTHIDGFAPPLSTGTVSAPVNNMVAVCVSM